jgi:hypothetical protein
MALISLTAAQTCRKFQCAAGGVVDPNDHNVCAKKGSDGVVLIGNCGKFDCLILEHGKTCDMNDKVNSTIYCHDKLKFKKLAGQKYEYTPKECFTEKFDSEGYCRGNKDGASCSNNGEADCDVDLYCSPERKVCLTAGRVGDHCGISVKCASHLICAYEYGGNSICREYGYYPNGHIIGVEDEDDICQSNYIDDEFTCQDGPLLIGKNLRDSEGESCQYTHGHPEESHCWYHSEGKAICKKGAKDLIPEWKKALAYLRLKPQCHVAIPMAQCDMGRKVVKTQEEFEDVWYAISRLHWEVHLEGLAPCMRQYVHPETFKFIKDSSASFIPVSILSFIALVFLAL